MCSNSLDTKTWDRHAQREKHRKRKGQDERESRSSNSGSHNIVREPASTNGQHDTHHLDRQMRPKSIRDWDNNSRACKHRVAENRQPVSKLISAAGVSCDIYFELSPVVVSYVFGSSLECSCVWKAGCIYLIQLIHKFDLFVFRCALRLQICVRWLRVCIGALLFVFSPAMSNQWICKCVLPDSQSTTDWKRRLCVPAPELPFLPLFSFLVFLPLCIFLAFSPYWTSSFNLNPKPFFLENQRRCPLFLFS